MYFSSCDSDIIDKTQLSVHKMSDSVSLCVRIGPEKDELRKEHFSDNTTIIIYIYMYIYVCVCVVCVCWSFFPSCYI